MKKVIIVGILLISLTIFKSVAQDNKIEKEGIISKSVLVGLWQINSPLIGAWVAECFRFYSDGKFIYKYDGFNDTRNIIELKGK